MAGPLAPCASPRLVTLASAIPFWEAAGLAVYKSPRKSASNRQPPDSVAAAAFPSSGLLSNCLAEPAGPFCFLIDCWQFEGSLIAWVAKESPHPLTATPCKFFAPAAYYLMEALRPGRMSSPGIAEPTEAIARAKAGDAQAWGQLYHDYAPAIFRFCRRALPTREDAEDATMEVFMKLKGKINQYDSSRPFSGWLYKVAANHCWDTLRRRKIRQDKETEDRDELPLEHPDT